MELHGVTGAPYKHPQVQKKLPAPHQRPRIDAGGNPVRRSWRQTKVIDLEVGDTVAEVGIIGEIRRGRLVDPTYYYCDLINVLGELHRRPIHDVVFAFRADE